MFVLLYEFKDDYDKTIFLSFEIEVLGEFNLILIFHYLNLSNNFALINLLLGLSYILSGL